MSMTKEQEDSIEILKNTDISTIELAEITDLHTYSIAVRNVLSMIKEKDRQINSKSGTINALQYALKERTEERDRKDNIVTKQNKIIDLTVEFIKNNMSEKRIIKEICIKGKCNNEECHEDNLKECIKQYFEKLAKEKG